MTLHDPIETIPHHPDTAFLAFGHMRLAKKVFLALTILGFLILAVMFWYLFSGLRLAFRWDLDWNVILSWLRSVIWLPVAWLAVTNGLLLLTLIVFREQWRISTTGIRHTGIFRTKRIDFADVTQLSWWPYSRVIILRSPRYRIPIFLDALNHAEQFQVIQLLRERVPERLQTWWPLFARSFLSRLERRLDSQPEGNTSQPSTVAIITQESGTTS